MKRSSDLHRRDSTHLQESAQLASGGGSWHVVTLEKLLCQQRRREKLEAARVYTRLGVRWYAQGCFAKEPVPGERIAGRHLFRVRTGDFVYSRLFAWKGSFAVVGEEFDGFAISNEFPAFEVNRDQTDPHYLWRYFSLPSVWSAVEHASSGSTRTSRLRFQEDDFLKLAIPLPPIAEQRAIVIVLRKVEMVKKACNQALAATRALKQSLLRHLFVFGATRFREADRIFLAEGNARAISKEWGAAPLGSLVVDGPQNGIYKPQSDYGDGTPIIRIDDFPNEGGLVTSAAKRLRLSSAERAMYSLRLGDLLINRVNSLSHLGKPALIGRIEEEMVFESNMMRLSIDPQKVLPEFVFRFLCCPGPRDVLRSVSKRAVAQSSVNQGDVMSLVVPLPSIPEQKSIVDVLSAVDEKLSAETARSAALDRLFQSLLHNLMSGKVRVDHLVGQLDPEVAS